MLEDWVDCRRGAVLDACLAWCAQQVVVKLTEGTHGRMTIRL